MTSSAIGCCASRSGSTSIWSSRPAVTHRASPAEPHRRALERCADRPPRAEEICRDASRSSARNPSSICACSARALTMQSRLEEAEQILRRALALRPESAPLHEDLGGVLAMQRRFEDAVASFQTAIRLDPQLPLARKKLGQALAALGRGAEADTALEGMVRAGSWPHAGGGCARSSARRAQG